MKKEKEVESRILLLEQITLELFRDKMFFTRRRILNRIKRRFAYSKPIIELIRYTELELELPDRDQVTKYADFLMHRSNLDRAYEEDEEGQV